MNDRFRFRATFPVSYYDENGNDKDIKLTVYDVAVYSGGEIGFSAQQMETIIDALKLSETEEDTIWQFINDNYATSSYEWFVCDNAIIEQRTGLKDKNGNLIYEGDIVRGRYFNPYHPDTPNPKIKGVVCFVENRMTWIVEDGDEGYDFEDCMEEYFEIIGNIHEQPEQKE